MRTTLFLASLLAVTQATQGTAQQRRSLPRLPTLESAGATTVVEALRGGGYVLACRHAITDHDAPRSGPFDLNDRTTQRNLSQEGEEQARRLGRALEALGIPIGEVYSSPYARTMESAQLAFGRAERDNLLYGNHSAAQFRERFTREPRGGNDVLMTHQGTLRRVMGYRQPGEGDCIVTKPGSERPEVIANVRVEEWERLAGIGTDGGRQERGD